MKQITAILVLTYGIMTGPAAAQEKQADSLAGQLTAVNDVLAKLSKVQISGYLQAQFQLADTAGISTFAGGNFKTGTDNRFMLRRARVKTAYNGSNTKFVFQVDVTEKGVSIKDVYAVVSEPWLGMASLTMGMMSRPFGFEIGYSSSKRESPERGRLSQTIFSGERDLGAMITIRPPSSSRWHTLQLEAGVYNGNGATGAVNDGSDWDKQKDFMGHLAWNGRVAGKKIDLGLGGSWYEGGLRQSNKFVYTYKMENGVRAMVADSADGNLFRIGKRRYMGGDAQLAFTLPVGKIMLRAEYIRGRQPGFAQSSASPRTDPVSDYGADLNANRKLDTYLRHFDGAYFYFVWRILNSKHEVVAKYDWYDPNTDVKGEAIDAAAGFTPADIRYDTWGLGWAYHWDRNVKLVAYYDFVTNETTGSLAGYKSDLKDNVLTIRLQYVF